METSQKRVLRVVERQRRKPECLKDYIIMAEVLDTYLSAVNSVEAEKWIAAMEEEIVSLKDNHTWNLREPTD